MKRLIRSSLLLLGLAFLALFSKRETDGFTIAKIKSDLSYNPAWETALSAPAPEILNQKYSYLGKGAQAFVFGSEDRRFVLKLFRHDHMRPRPWSAWLKRPGDERRKAKLFESFSSYKIAADCLHEECGLVFLHLNKTKSLKTKLRIVDKIGILHELEADDVEFLVQKKAELLYPAIEKRVFSGQLEEAGQLLASLRDLIKSERSKGVADKDPNPETNFGILDGRVVQIDIGRFRFEEKSEAEQKEELERILDPLFKRLPSLRMRA